MRSFISLGRILKHVIGHISALGNLGEESQPNHRTNSAN